MYDGLSLLDKSWELTQGTLVDGQSLQVILNKSITKVGETENTAAITILNNHNTDVTSNYAITEDFGILSIEHRPITIETMSGEKTYDGMPLISYGWQLSQGSIADNQTLQVVITSELISAGQKDNTAAITIFDTNNQPVTENYNINLLLGTLTVYPRQMRIRTETKEKFYDGIKLVGEGFEIISGTAAPGETIEIKNTASITLPGVIDNQIDVSIVNENLQPTISNYNITYELGYLAIYQREITIETETNSKVYDGLPLYGDDYRMIEGSLLSTHTMDVVTRNPIIDVGYVINEVYITITDIDSQEVTHYYNIYQQYGYLEIRPRQILITTANAEKEYDGTPLSAFDYTLSSGTLVVNHVINTNMYTTITTPGQKANQIGVEIQDELGQVKTDNYLININAGILEVHQRKITFETGSASKIYDGTSISNKEIDLISGSLVGNHYETTILSTSRIDVGRSFNQAQVSIYNEFNEDITRYYSINILFGELIIEPIEVLIKTSEATKIYDGIPLTNGGWYIEQGYILSSHYINVNLNSSITNVGSIYNTATTVIYDQNGQPMTKNYSIMYDYGELEVLPRQLTITTGSDQKMYDGTPLKNGEWYLIEGILVDDHSLIVNVVSERTVPGTTPNYANFDIVSGNGENVKNNYTVFMQAGELKVYQREVIVETASDSKIYDGTPLINHNWQITNGSFLSDHTPYNTMNSSIVNVGEISNSIYFDIVDETGSVVTHYYLINYEIGTLVVEHRVITIETASDSKVYDGLPLSNDDWRELDGSLAAYDYYNITMTSNITIPGAVKNKAFIEIRNQYNENVTFNYSVLIKEGYLTVYSRKITIETESDSKIYDGTPLTNHNWHITSGSVVEYQTTFVSMDAWRTDVGVTSNYITFDILDESGNVVTQYYDIYYNIGFLVIEPKGITIETATDEKVYDGLSLSNEGWHYVHGQLALNDYITISVPSMITIPGTIKNVAFVEFFNEYGENVTKNYDLNVIEGNLTVYKQRLVILTGSYEKTYDATPLSGLSFEMIEDRLINGHFIVEVMPSEILYPGIIENEIFITIYNELNIDVTNYYEFSFLLGELKITPIPITLKSSSAHKVYDGTPLSNDNWEIMYGNILPGHHLIVDIEGEITDVGTINNLIFGYVTDQFGNDVTKYYEFNYNVGELTILQSLYSSDEIALEPFESDDSPVLEIFGARNETVYLRDKSFGAYNLKGWDEAVVHQTPIQYNPLSFVSITLRALNLPIEEFQIKYLREQVPNLVPYFTTDTINGLNDIQVLQQIQTIHIHNRISFDYTKNKDILLPSSLLTQDELLYRAHVYNTYLSLPESTQESMLLLAMENNLDKDSPNIIREIQLYIQNAATYNRKFGKIPADVDVAVYFLETLKEGICQHFAAAATLMYRALGIPARYVTGYIGYAKANRWVEVSGEQAHAWVEIYIEGIGWMPIEVTGGDNGPDGSGGGPGGEENPLEITVKPRNVIEPFVVGKTIYANDAVITGFNQLRNQGYTYTATFIGELSRAGVGISYIDQFTIYNPDGEDVTNEFDITYQQGKLQQYVYTINLQTSNATEIYDGQALINHDYNITGSLGVNHFIQSIKFTDGQLNVGVGVNSAQLTIHNIDGENVTDLYYVVNHFGTLTVTPRKITVESNSDQKRFDGTPLTAMGLEIIDGSLAQGETIEYQVSGSQTSIGRSDNIIDTIHIMNNGQYTTNNYEIMIIEGTLTVTP